MQKEKKRRSKFVSKKVLFWIGLPTLLTFLYLFFLARPVYESEARLIIRENKDGGVSLTSGLAASFLGGGGQASLEDAYILEGFLHGTQFLELADQKLNLREHFGAPWYDPHQALWRNASAEDFAEYLRKRLVVQIDPTSRIVTIKAKAFDPEMAQNMANLLIHESEKAINILNARMISSQTALANRELEQSKENLRERRQKLLQFQTEHTMVNPEAEVGSHLTNVAGLDAKLVERRAELRAKQQYMREDAFDIRVLQQEISALEAQRAHETGNLISSSDKSMAAALLSYEDLKLQAEFALKAYTSAFALVETAKLEAGRQEKFLLLITPPHLPDAPVSPLPFFGTLTALAIFAIFYGVARLVIATIRDHSI